MLLPVAIHDEQRVVDRDAEADQHHHVLHVGRELHVLRKDPDDPERDRNRHGGEHQRQQKRQRSEDEDQQEKRDRDRDVELADLEVAREDRIEVVLDRRLSSDVHPRVGNRPDGAAHRAGVALGVGRVERRHDRRRRHVLRHGARSDEASRRHSLRRANRRSAQRRNDRRGIPVRVRDERERACRFLPEVIVEDALRAAGVRSGKREPVRQQAREPGRGPAADHEEADPHREDRLAVMKHPPCPMFHHARAARFRRLTPGARRTAAYQT